MPVYMFQAGGPTGPVKIGYGDTVGRLHDCQVGNDRELRIIRQFEGGLAEEIALHSRFADLWIRGEWHNFSRAMLGDVGLTEIVAPVPELPPGPESISAGDGPDDAVAIGAHIRAVRKSHKLTQEQFAACVGLSRTAVAMIETGQDLPGRAALWRICRFFGVPFDVEELPHD